MRGRLRAIHALKQKDSVMVGVHNEQRQRVENSGSVERGSVRESETKGREKKKVKERDSGEEAEVVGAHRSYSERVRNILLVFLEKGSLWNPSLFSTQRQSTENK